MRARQRGAIRRHRAGITMTEMIVATTLGTFLVILLATTWSTFGATALEVEARARVEREGVLAIQSLAYDISGFLDDEPTSPSSGRPWGKMSDGGLNPYQFSKWDTSNSEILVLYFSDGSTSTAYCVKYELQIDPDPRQGYQLVRVLTKQSTPVWQSTVARHVVENGLNVIPAGSNQVQIQLTIRYRNIQSTFILIGVQPPP